MRFGYVTLVGMMMTWPAVAGPPQPVTPTTPSHALDAVIGCRNITDGTERLACFDRSVDALQSATTKHDIVVVDREEVRKTRRSLFGFSLPDGGVFGANSEKRGAVTPEDEEISSTVRSARVDPDGNWVVVLDDGAIWHQTGGTLALTPKPGTPVTIRRAALGSYFMRIGKLPGVKARREG